MLERMKGLITKTGKAYGQRITAVALAVCMMLPPMPVTSFGDVAGNGGDIIVSDVCTHHTHDEACGFVEADPGNACGHEHSEDCYTGELICDKELPV